jgi:uncharacterized integral membrane protein
VAVRLASAVVVTALGVRLTADGHPRRAAAWFTSLVSSDPTPSPATRADRRERNRRIAALVVGVVIIVLAVANFDDVRVNWIVAKTSTPLVVVIAVSFLLGLGGGYLLRRRHGKRG